MSTSIKLGACSFLRRYGANSYITNIPLFFKKQDPEAPQKKGSDLHKTNQNSRQETYVVEKDAALKENKKIKSNNNVILAKK